MTQVIKKRRIVLASVLKPVDDTRMLEKLGVTLADTGEWAVTIIGYPSSNVPEYPGIEFKPVKRFSRFSFGRLIAPWRAFQTINQAKPEVIIINTPELLMVAIMSKILFGRKIIYDVLENYYRNIRFTPAFPVWSRLILATVVRLMEYITKPFINLYLLAEKGYAYELGFAKPFVIAENKLPEVLAERYSKSSVSDHHHLLFTGTLAPTTGILEAITLCKELHKIDSSYTLTIVGSCAMPEFLSQIMAEISGLDFICLNGGSSLVPHSRILSEIRKADAGIIIYSVNSSTESSIPTKLYEYLALRLPVIISHNEDSHELVKRLEGGIQLTNSVDFLLLNSKLKTLTLPMEDTSLFWDQEGKKVINALKLL